MFRKNANNKKPVTQEESIENSVDSDYVHNNENYEEIAIDHEAEQEEIPLKKNKFSRRKFLGFIIIFLGFVIFFSGRIFFSELEEI